MHNKSHKFVAIYLAVALFVSCTVFIPSTAKAADLTWFGGSQGNVTVSGTTIINVHGDNQVSTIIFTNNSSLTIKGSGTLYIGNLTSTSGINGTNYSGGGSTGNSSYGSSGVNITVLIDGPTVTCTLTDGADPIGGSGVERTEYQIDGGEWTRYTSPIDITAATTINARTIDVASNISSISTVAIQVDQIAPATSDYQLN